MPRRIEVIRSLISFPKDLHTLHDPSHALLELSSLASAELISTQEFLNSFLQIQHLIMSGVNTAMSNLFFQTEKKQRIREHFLLILVRFERRASK
nr:unnamed protein product [Callosobruchus chinensis]